MTIQQPGGTTWTATYAYDGAHRLDAVVADGLTYDYVYSSGPTPAPASPHWTQLNLPNTTKIARSYDTQGRLTGTALKTSANAVLNKHDYLYDNRHERTRQTRTDTSYVDYTYDKLGQVKTS